MAPAEHAWGFRPTEVNAMHASPQSVDERAALKARLFELWERTGDEALHRLAEGQPPREGAPFATDQERADWISTCLMESYKNTGDPSVFALLYELNLSVFALAVQGHMRRTWCRIDPHDVLQEAFCNIYRYPHKFASDRADAFRNWGHRIVRNTLLKAVRGAGKQAHLQSLDDEIQVADERMHAPDRIASEGEGATLVNQAFLICLQLYLMNFERLSEKERRALTMVEVEDLSYRDAAAALGIRVENLKMVIFRGRRKIFRGMERSLADLGRGGAAVRPIKSAIAARPAPVPALGAAAVEHA